MRAIIKYISKTRYEATATEKEEEYVDVLSASSNSGGEAVIMFEGPHGTEVETFEWVIKLTVDYDLDS